MPSKTTIELRISVNRGGKLFLTPRIVELLREVASSGSLRTAAARLKVSYQYAWETVEALNKAAAKQIVRKQRGGTGGGGASLTPYGELALREYSGIESEVRKFAGRLNAEINF